ncbi:MULTISPECIES: uracil/xanthine transporter [unclassified Serratia (in: enterobacteria)]|uniref:uracil/xanthine transporter n=1 Tax=unclassified Serratia (in: enterobacteria) TaxID=2647522 RepID=UPI00050390DB|nr:MULTISPECIES: uracil/xanthine transporter [unclassified Serratia (in: enterobacteria)]KFK95299.1 uracil/xanthine transporter [Serratia sp. Ag2]KFK98647.1 uracil/xanthine transporter [Serratia sp. Ag1]
MSGTPWWRGHLLSGFQWFFFIFCNTVVVPPTLQSAFHLSPRVAFCITQYTFLATAIACLFQVIGGHRRAIMEGPTGLWWVTILTLTLAESANGTPLPVIGGSLAVGIFLSGILTIVIGVTGLGHRLAALFRPAVMGTFMFLLGAQLVAIFMKGMFGLPFGAYNGPVIINYQTFSLAVAIMLLIVVTIIFLPRAIGKYALLIGAVVGWVAYSLIFKPDALSIDSHEWLLFPLGQPQDLRPGIIVSALLAGLINISNSFGAIRGTDAFYGDQPASKALYRRSFFASGLLTCFSAPLGVVPFSPFVSSIGLITQTQDSSRQSFIIGSLLFLLIAAVPALARFFCAIPLTISSAVMLVSYLPLLYSAFFFFNQITLSPKNIYRLAFPLFFGIFFMSIPASFLHSVPVMIRPLLSNGLLIGVMLSVLLENILPWDRLK